VAQRDTPGSYLISTLIENFVPGQFEFDAFDPR
jgi:hypothetical protein